MEDKSLLQRADETINGPRAKDYGSASENFQRIADIWSAVLGTEVTQAQVALCMIGVKMARLINSPDHEDSWLDIAGYAGLSPRLEIHSMEKECVCAQVSQVGPTTGTRWIVGENGPTLTSND